jgi:hypothetical protein
MDDRTTRYVDEPAARPTADADEQRARELRSDIEQTRDDMSETVDAIQDRLRPSNVVAQAKAATADKAREMASSAADTAEEWWEASGGQGLVDRIRNHPVPAAMAGAGLLWLAFSNGRHRQPYRYRTYRTVERPARPGLRSYEEVRNAPTYEGRNAPAYRRSASDEGMAQARRAIRGGRSRVETMIQQYPLAVGAAALLVGASLGLAVPETESENELMGETRDTAVQRAQEAATGAVDRVKEAAADAVTRAAMGDSTRKQP